MATPVPYTGEVDQTLQNIPIPQLHVNTPPEAFGGAVAGALTHMGQTVDGAGKELFARAYAMQEMDEFAKADMAASRTFKNANLEYLKLAELKGPELTAALPGYMERLQKIREDGMGDLTSPIARQTYMKDTLRNESTMIWHGGALARQGMDETNKIAGKAKIEALGDTLVALPMDTKQANQQIDEIKSTISDYIHTNFGLSPGDRGYDGIANDFLSEQIAKAAKARIVRDPEDGKKFTEYFIKNSMLHPKDAAVVGELSDRAIDTHEASKFAHNMASGADASWVETKHSIPDTIAAMKRSGLGSYSATVSLPNGDRLVGKYGINSAVVAEFIDKAALTDERGKAVTDEKDFLNSIQAQDQFAEFIANKLDSTTKNFHEFAKAWWGQEDPTKLALAAGHIAHNADPSVLREKTVAEMLKKFPNNVAAAERAGDIAIGNQNSAQRSEFLAEHADRDKLTNMIDGHGTQDGRVPVSKDDLFKIDGAKELYYKLDDKGQKDILRIIDENNYRWGGVRPTEWNVKEFERLTSIGLRRDTTATSKELEELVQYDFLHANFTKDQRTQLRGLQNAVIKGEIQNPEINKAIHAPAVQQLLDEANIKKGTEEYNSFLATYNYALQQYGYGAERPIKSDDEFIKIAEKLVSREAAKWWNVGGLISGGQPFEGLANTSNVMRRRGEDLFRIVNGRNPIYGDENEEKQLNDLLLRETFRELGRKATSTGAPVIKGLSNDQ
jgi:hypothetical protein